MSVQANLPHGWTSLSTSTGLTCRFRAAVSLQYSNNFLKISSIVGGKINSQELYHAAIESSLRPELAEVAFSLLAVHGFNSAFCDPYASLWDTRDSSSGSQGPTAPMIVCRTCPGRVAHASITNCRSASGSAHGCRLFLQPGLQPEPEDCCKSLSGLPLTGSESRSTEPKGSTCTWDRHP